MHIRLSVGLVLVSLASVTPASALAWQEAHETGADVRMRVAANGVASIALHQRWHVVHGPLRFVDVVGVDPAAVLAPEARVLAEDGHELVAHAARQDDRTVRVTFDDPHAMAHGGTFALEVPMRVDLVATEALVRDGARWRLTWSNPVASDGFDGAATRLELPAAPDPPQPILAQTGAVDETAAATLRREPAQDVLELERPHVSRGEAVAWTVRLDPRGMTQVTDPRLRPPAEAPPKEPDRVGAVSMAACLTGLALALALLVAGKSRAFRVACAERAARPRSLLPLPDPARAALAGAALAAAVGLEVAGGCATWAAAACIAVATLSSSLRAPLANPVARGPGRWLVLRPQDAFSRDAHRSGAPRWLDASTAAGRFGAVLAAALVAAAALTIGQFDRSAAWLVLLDAAPLLPLFVTGTSSQLPPHPARSAVPWMAAAYRRLRSVETLRVAPWARVAAQPPGPDELRLLVLPRAALPGLVGVEIGLAWCSTPVGWTARPEVLARVIEGTPAAARLAAELPALRLVPGRRPDERVAVLPPRAPTRRGGIFLARALAGALTDRRVSYPPRIWTAPERRAPPQRCASPTSDAA
jgi:hypothetical protein